MASFWDSVKAFFGAGPRKGGAGDLEARVREEMRSRARAKASFEVADVATALQAPFAEVEAAVEAAFQAGVLEEFGFKRWDRPTATVLFNPYTGELPGAPGSRPAAPAAKPPPAAPPPKAGPTAPAASPSPPAPSGPATYAANPEVMGLSPEALRARAMKLRFTGEWWARTNVIPPASDERTALIDRGLVLHGLLTEAQLAELHAVGDAWLKVHEAQKMAKALATASADASLEARAEAKRREKEAKREAAKAREAARVAAVAQRRATDIVYLGPGVSFGLADRRCNVEALTAKGLPVLATPADVAAALGLEVKVLRWLCFHAEAAERLHYVPFEVPKRSGGTRRILAPLPKLAQAQQWVLANVLEKLPTEAPAHGFVPGRSTVTNASEHLGRALVVNLDLKDFFPTITFPRVRGVFEGLGYSPAVATVLALLCTEAPRQEMTYAGAKLWVAVGPRALPQGACTSPALSNQVARRLDRRLAARVTPKGWTYTRYADDLTFSHPTLGREAAGWVMAVARHVLAEEGFALNPKKGRVQVRAAQQTVTGVVVNVKPGVPRAERKRLRAVLHQAKKTGLAAQNRAGVPNYRGHLEGMVAYVSMVNAAHGQALKKALDEVRD